MSPLSDHLIRPCCMRLMGHSTVERATRKSAPEPLALGRAIGTRSSTSARDDAGERMQFATSSGVMNRRSGALAAVASVTSSELRGTESPLAHTEIEERCRTNVAPAPLRISGMSMCARSE